MTKDAAFGRHRDAGTSGLGIASPAMDWLRNFPMGALAVAGGTIVAICWIVFSGTLPLVVSILFGGLVAFKATLGPPDEE